MYWLASMGGVDGAGCQASAGGAAKLPPNKAAINNVVVAVELRFTVFLLGVVVDCDNAESESEKPSANREESASCGHNDLPPKC